jgi:hypothetical protein
MVRDIMSATLPQDVKADNRQVSRIVRMDRAGRPFNNCRPGCGVVTTHFTTKISLDFDKVYPMNR